MTRANEPSTYERPEWPLNALPKHWVEALFAKMSAFYGSRFATMWSGSKVEDVQKAWGIELFKLTREQLKAGSESLTAFPKPPTLPEFVMHCRQARIEVASRETPKIENRVPADPKRVEEAMRTVRKASERVIRCEPTAEWAYRLLMSGRNGMPHQVIRNATDAITSSAGKRAIDACLDVGLKAEFETIRNAVVDDYQQRGIPLWEVR